MAQPSPGAVALKLLRSIAVSIAVAVLTAAVAFVISYLLFPVTGVEVNGARMFPESEAWEALPNHASLLTLRTASVEERVKYNPWVKGVTIQKDWESGIVTVEVQERRAALNGEMDGRRVVLASDGSELPGLGGADLERVELDETRLEEILRVSEVLEENEISLGSVDRVGAGGFEATVEGRRVLFAGGVGEGQVRALSGFMEEHPEASYFDLRSPKRIVAGSERSGG